MIRPNVILLGENYTIFDSNLYVSTYTKFIAEYLLLNSMESKQPLLEKQPRE